MDHRLIEGLMEAVVPAVREYVTAEIIKARAPLLLRIETLEACGQPLQGPPGEPGKSVSVDDVRPLLKEMVEALPRAKDGVGVAGALINREGELVLTLSNGSTRQLGLVVGRDGAPGMQGKSGRDGWSLEQFDTELMPDGRTLRLKFVSGDTVEIHDLCLGLMLYQGVWRPGSYERGDTVTLGGSLWHCNVPTSEKPDDGSKAWTLAAKRGRDGKDGKPGEKGMPGPAGNPGRDGRQW